MKMNQSAFNMSLIAPNQAPELINNTLFKQALSDSLSSKQRRSVVIGNHGFTDSRNISLDGHDDHRELTVEQLDKELDEYARERRRLLAVKRAQEAKERYALRRELESVLAAEEESLQRDLDIFRHDGQRAVPFFHSMNQANDVQPMMF